MNKMDLMNITTNLSEDEKDALLEKLALKFEIKDGANHLQIAPMNKWSWQEKGFKPASKTKLTDDEKIAVQLLRERFQSALAFVYLKPRN